MSEETGTTGPAPTLRVSGAARVILVVAAALVGLMLLPRARDPGGAGYVVGRVLGTVGLPLLVGWLLARRGWTASVNPAIILLAVGGVASAVPRQSDRDRELQAAMQDFARRRADDPGRAQAAERTAQAIEKAAEAGDTDMQAMTRMLRRVKEPVVELERLTGEFREAGAVRAETLDSLATIDARRELLGRVRAQAERVRDLQKNFVADSEAELRSGGAAPEILDGFLAQARDQKARLDAMLELRESDVRYYAICDQVLELFRDRFGAWRIDPRDRALTFDDPADLAAFNAAKKALRDEIDAQERLEAASARAR